MKPLPLLAFAALASAQVFPAQSICPTAARYIVPLTPPLPMVYGSFTCDIPLPNGTYPVSLSVIENRRANGADGPVGVGLRVFNFLLETSAGGPTFGPLDPFAAVGAQVPVVAMPVSVVVSNGNLHLASIPSTGNPTLISVTVGPCAPCAPLGIQPLQVSDIGNVTGMVVQLADGTTRLVPLGVLAIVPTGPVPTVQLAGPGSVADWQICSGSGGKSDCSGINYVALRKVDGSQVKLAAVPFPPSVTPAPPNWSPVN